MFYSSIAALIASFFLFGPVQANVVLADFLLCHSQAFIYFSHVYFRLLVR